jgi:hypothetical protein
MDQTTIKMVKPWFLRIMKWIMGNALQRLVFANLFSHNSIVRKQ